MDYKNYFSMKYLRVALIFWISLIYLEATHGVGNIPDRPQAYWVYFDRRDTSETARQQAIDRLDEKAVQRRLRAMGKILAQNDFPLHPDDLKALRERHLKIRTISTWLGAVSVEINEAMICELSALPHVHKITCVNKGRPNPAPNPIKPPPQRVLADSASYGAAWVQNNMLGVPAVHGMGYRGEGVRVGFLDDGYSHLHLHVALQNLNVVGVWNVIDQDENLDFGNHGTRVVSVMTADHPNHMVGVAPEAEVLLVRTEDSFDEYPAEEDYWVAGLEWAEAEGADFISTSLGYYEWYEFEDLDGNTAVTTIAGDMAAARGLLVVTSVGNRWNAGVTAPADGDSVLAVGAVHSNGERANFSSHGPTVDGRIKPEVDAMGWLTTVINDTSVDGYYQRSGTSYACPLVAGALAILLQANPDLLPLDLIRMLQETGSQADDPDNLLGWGVVNLHAALGRTLGWETMTIPLLPNYFELLSSYLTPENIIIENVFGYIGGLRIVYQNDGRIFIPPIINTIGEYNILQGYRVFCSFASSWTVIGDPIPLETEFSLSARLWNWLPYPFDHSLPVETALENITDQLIIVMNDAGFFWIPDVANTLETMTPGEGYYVYVNENVTFQYQDAGGMFYQSNQRLIDDSFVLNDFPRPTGLPYAILVAVSPELRSQGATTVSVYDGGLLVGKSVLGENGITPLTAWQGAPDFDLPGFTAGNKMSFRVESTDGKSIPVLASTPSSEFPRFGANLVDALSESLVFGAEPYSYVTLSSQTGVTPPRFTVDSAYPNPFNPVTIIPFALPKPGKIIFELSNVLGQQAYRLEKFYQAGFHEYTVDFSKIDPGFTSGIYLLTINFGNDQRIQKILFLK